MWIHLTLKHTLKFECGKFGLKAEQFSRDVVQCFLLSLLSCEFGKLGQVTQIAGQGGQHADKTVQLCAFPVERLRFVLIVPDVGFRQLPLYLFEPITFAVEVKDTPSTPIRVPKVPAVTPAVDSTFDVAVWLAARARADRAELAPLQLQRLLFLAQAYFAGSTHGRQLMPSQFITSRAGPLEPNVARIRDLETPMIEVQELRKPIADFLEGIWQAFGALPIDRLDQTVMSAAPVEVAMRRKEPSEITVRAMAEFYGAGGIRPQTVTSSGDQRATIPKFHQGKPVNKWVPGQKRGGR